MTQVPPPPGPQAPPPVTDPSTMQHFKGSGTTIVVPANAVDEAETWWVDGEPFPRLVLDVAHSAILVGTGQAAPTSIGVSSVDVAGLLQTVANEIFSASGFTLQAAHNDAAAQIAAAFTTGSAKPAVPVITAVHPSTGQVIVDYTEGSNGGSAILDFTLRIYLANGQASSVVAVTSPDGTTFSLTALGLADNTVYKATVSARNANGSSAESAFSAQFTPPALAPDPPIFQSNAPSTTSVSVFFAPGSDNGAPITSYTATATSSDGGTTRTATGTSSPLVIANLTSAKHYTTAVTATNIKGTSAASAPSPSFLVGSAPVGNAAVTRLGMFTNEPDFNGASEILANETLLGHTLYAVQMNMSPAPGGVDNIWGCTSDSQSTHAGDSAMCIGYDSRLHPRIKPVLDIPLAVGGPTDGDGVGFEMSAAQKITRLNNVENGTYDGTHDVVAFYYEAARLYYRDRNISCKVTSGSNGVDVSTFAGSGTLHVDDTAGHAFLQQPFASTGVLYVTLGGFLAGVVRISYTGKTANTFTGCTYLGRCTVGGGSGPTTISTGGYIGSGTGFTNFIGNYGWEFDGDWFAWGARKPTTYFNGSTTVPDNTATQAELSAQFVATYKHVVELHRLIGWDSHKAVLTGDPGLFMDRKADIIDVLTGTAAAPARTADGVGRYVDTLGHDVYDQDQSNDYSSLLKGWISPFTAWARMLGYLQQLDTVAAAAGCSVCIGEWSCVSDRADGLKTGGDNPTFVHGFFLWLNGHSPGSGAGQLEYAIQFDSNNETANFSLKTNKPKALAQFLADFGTVGSLPVTTGPGVSVDFAATAGVAPLKSYNEYAATITGGNGTANTSADYTLLAAVGRTLVRGFNSAQWLNGTSLAALTAHGIDAVVNYGPGGLGAHGNGSYPGDGNLASLGATMQSDLIAWKTANPNLVYVEFANEPDEDRGDGGWTQAQMSAYWTMASNAVKGANAALGLTSDPNRLKFGGPCFAQPANPTSSGYASGGLLTTMSNVIATALANGDLVDFLSFHNYVAGYTNPPGGAGVGFNRLWWVPKSTYAMTQLIRQIAVNNGIGGIEIMCTEYDAANSDDWVNDHDNPSAFDLARVAAFMASSYYWQMEAGLDKTFWFAETCYNLPHESILAYRGNVDISGKVYPAYNVQKMWSMLKPTRVAVAYQSPAGLDPTYGTGVGAVASKATDGNTASILAWNFKGPNTGASVATTFFINHLPPGLSGRTITVQRYLVDETHSNYANNSASDGLVRLSDLSLPAGTVSFTETLAENSVELFVLT